MTRMITVQAACLPQRSVLLCRKRGRRTTTGAGRGGGVGQEPSAARNASYTGAFLGHALCRAARLLVVQQVPQPRRDGHRAGRVVLRHLVKGDLLCVCARVARASARACAQPRDSTHDAHTSARRRCYTLKKPEMRVNGGLRGLLPKRDLRGAYYCRALRTRARTHACTVCITI